VKTANVNRVRWSVLKISKRQILAMALARAAKQKSVVRALNTRHVSTLRGSLSLIATRQRERFIERNAEDLAHQKWLVRFMDRLCSKWE
jgi:hypothetical protein